MLPYFSKTSRASHCPFLTQNREDRIGLPSVTQVDLIEITHRGNTIDSNIGNGRLWRQLSWQP